MPNEQAITVLNGLLAAESASLVARLGEADPFFTKPSAQGQVLIRRLTATNESHCRLLGETIFKLRGTPVSPQRPMTWGGLHYLDFDHLLPEVVAAVAGLVDTYRAASGATSDAAADALLTRLLREYEQHLDNLAALRAGVAPADGRP